MNGLREIREMNRGTPAKRVTDYRVQRDKLAKVLRRVLDEDVPQGRTPKVFGAVEAAEKVLAEIEGGNDAG